MFILIQHTYEYMNNPVIPHPRNTYANAINAVLYWAVNINKF